MFLFLFFVFSKSPVEAVSVLLKNHLFPNVNLHRHTSECLTSLPFDISACSSQAVLQLAWIPFWFQSLQSDALAPGALTSKRRRAL